MGAQEKSNVSLREYLDMQIGFVKTELSHVREKILHEKELGIQASKALTKALELQAEKYEERLKALNHEAQRLSKMVSAEMFESVTGQLRKEGDERASLIKVIQLWISNQEGKQSRAQWISIISTIIAMAAFLYSVFKN